MYQPRIPFRFMDLSKDSLTFVKPGHIISTLDECGIFICTKGCVEVSLDDKCYQIYPRDIYIYMPSTLVRLIKRSKDAEGILVATDINFAISVVQRVIGVPHLLHLGKHPCISLSEGECNRLQMAIENLRMHISNERFDTFSLCRQRLMLELVKSIGQSIIYGILNIYFAHQPVQVLLQSKKDIVFQNFLLALFQNFRTQRDVSFYADLQHLTSRYFSAIVKEKSGATPLQWIVRMVISEAKFLLETSELSIKEIAMKLNFPNQSFFGRYFKQYVGISPKEYRSDLPFAFEL